MLTNHYPTILAIHNILRWFVLLSGLVLILGCLLGKLKQLPFKKAGRVPAMIYVSLMDTQFLLGVLLSFASPITRAFWSDPSAGMKSHDLRFFTIEHTTLMIVALVLAHIGSVRSRKITTDAAAYATALKWYIPSFLLILAGIPWWRPFFG
jgi:hypothetical protein